MPPVYTVMICFFHRLPGGPGEGVEPSEMGMNEPLASLPVYTAEPGKKDLIIVPGLFFSLNGIPHGGGAGDTTTAFCQTERRICMLWALPFPGSWERYPGKNMM